MRTKIIPFIAFTISILALFSSLTHAMDSNSSYDSNTLPDITNSSTNHIHLNTTADSSNSSAHNHTAIDPEHIHPDINLSAALLMNGTAEIKKVNIEDFAKNNPSAVSPPGLPVRFFKVNAQNVSYETFTINVTYSEMELKGIDEKDLSFFRYEPGNSTWVMLPAKVDKEGNTLEAVADSLSLFAVSFHSENTSDHDHNNTAGVDDSSLHDCSDMEYMPISVSFIEPGNAKISLELESRNSSNSPLPGTPVKFFRIDAGNLSYSRVNIEIAYSDSGLKGADENNLSVFHYSNSTWTALPTEANKDENILSAYVDSLSLFAISSFSGKGNTHMDMGKVSDCLRCHGSSSATHGGSMMGGGIPKINESIMNQSIHASLNNASSNLNRACWACHSNSTSPPSKHPPMHRPSSLACSACHVSGTDGFNSPQTTEHTTHAANITVNATCQLCHGKPEMVNLNGSTVNSTISHYGKKRGDLILNKTNTDCSYCHQNPVSEFADVFNKTSRTNISHNGNLSCSSCHGAGRIHNSTLVNMQGYNLSDCVQCHGAGGFALNKVSESAINRSIHANLNSANISLNRACWTCHSNLIAEPQAHPDIARQPNACSACHIDGALNLTKKLKPNHLTQHTSQASRVKVPVVCTLCHSNDAVASGRTINSTVSHYGRYPQVETRDCVNCHQNENIGERWGNPPDPRETIPLASIEKGMVSDEIWKLNQNYSIAVGGVDKEGQSVWLEMYYNGKLIWKELVSEGGNFKYDTKIEQSGVNKTVVELRVADIFYGGSASLITLSGNVPKHIHTETSSIQCYACHVKDYRPDKPDGYRYFVLKKESQNVTLNQLDIDFTATDRKTISSSESWDLGSGYELSIKDFSPNRDYVWLVLAKDGNIVKEDFVREGDDFTYNATLKGVDITMLRLRIANLFVKG